MPTYTDNRLTLLDCDITTVTLNDAEFVIDTTKEVSRGGTCLVYYAAKKEAAHIARKVILKEFYPLTANCWSWRQKDGSLALPKEDPEVAFKKSRFEKSRELFVQLHNEDCLNLNIAEAQDYIHSNGTVYMVVDYSSGKSLQAYLTEADHSLYDTLSMLKNLAVVLSRIHGQGYLHMDLKPDNVLCFENALIRVIDTDSFLRKNELLSSHITLSISKGFTAPEVVLCAENPQNYSAWRRLSEHGERADVYSFGAILYCYLFGQIPEPVTQRRSPGKQASNTSQLKLKLRERYPDIPQKAVRLIQNLLNKTLARLTADRYKAMEDIIGAIEELLPLVSPKQLRIAEAFCRNPYPVVGREQKLAALRESFLQQEKLSRIVCVTGLGGIGKSTLARRYGEAYAEEYDIITEVSAATAADAVRQIRILNWEPDEALSAQENLEEKIAKLVELCHRFRTLIIVNNYDVSYDPFFPIWKQLHCDIILTSRHDWTLSGEASVALRCEDLSLEQAPHAAEQIFTHYYLHDAGSEADKTRLLQQLMQEKQELLQLLARLNYHPLGIKLTARQMAAVPGQEMLPSQALEELEQEGFQQDSPVEFQNDRDNRILEENVYGHLNSIFRAALQSGRLKQEDQTALRYMLLASPAYGISANRFAKWTDRKAIYLERLRKHGWLEYDPSRSDPLDGEDHRGIYLLPLVIQQVLQKEPVMMCTGENCASFLQRSADTSADQYDTYEQRRILCEEQERLIRIFDQEHSEIYARLLHSAAVNLYNLNPYRAPSSAILSCFDECAYILHELQLHDHPLLMDCFINIGVIYHMQGARQEAYSCFRYALDYGKEHHIPNKANHVHILLNMSRLYWDIGQMDKAVSMARQALETVDPKDESYDSGRIVALSTLGEFLRDMGHWEEAEAHLTSAAGLCVKQFDDNGGSGAKASYANILWHLGALYLAQKAPDRALEHLLRALDMARELYGEKNVSFVVEIMRLLADTYTQKGDAEAAIPYREAVLAIYKDNTTKAHWSLPEHYVYSALDAKPLDLEKLHRMPTVTKYADNERLFPDCMLNLALDYIKIDPKKTTEYIYAAIAAYNSLLGSYYVPVSETEYLYILYYRQAMKLFRRSLIPDGLHILETWISICGRLYGNTMETAIEYWCISRVFRLFGIPRKAEYYRKQAKACKAWSPAKMAVQWMHASSRLRSYTNTDGIYVLRFQDFRHLILFAQLLKTIRRIKKRHRINGIKNKFGRFSKFFRRG